jgi:hypothetical protein
MRVLRSGRHNDDGTMILPFRSLRRPGKVPRHLVHTRANALRAPDQAAGDDGAVAFWQMEVHQFEFRAGEQGALAQSVLAVATALTTAAVTGLAAGNLAVSDQAMDELNAWIKFAFLLLPVTILQLLTTALRLLGEAGLLREVVRHAETELEKLTSRATGLDSYRKWTALGLPYDAPRPFLIAFVPLTVIICAAGVFGTTVLVGFSLGLVWGWALTGAAFFFLVMLVKFACANFVNAHSVRVALAGARREKAPEAPRLPSMIVAWT